MIYHRKAPFISNSEFGFVNYTYFYMTNPYHNSNGSELKISDSRFENVNIRKNITALTIYGGQEFKLRYIAPSGKVRVRY